MKKKSILKYLLPVLLVALIAFFGFAAAKGSEIHDKVCPKVSPAKVKTVLFDGMSYNCINKACVMDGKVYEIYKQKVFFNDNIRVKEVEVSTLDVFPDEDMIAITGGITGPGSTYYAVIPDEGLKDGEAVVVLTKERSKQER